MHPMQRSTHRTLTNRTLTNRTLAIVMALIVLGLYLSIQLVWAAKGFF